MNYILFDDLRSENFRPLTFTKTTADLFTGCFTNRQRWEWMLEAPISSLTHDYLQVKYPIKIEAKNILINGRLIPNKSILKDINKLTEGEILVHYKTVLAANVGADLLKEFLEKAAISKKFDRHAIFSNMDVRPVGVEFAPIILKELWDLFEMNETLIKTDLEYIDKKQFDQKLLGNNTSQGDQIYIHPTAKVSASILNATTGPIIIDEGAEIMEGCMIRGPFYLGKNATLKMGAKIYGATSIGEASKVGGEVSNSVISAYSNKGHDGFMGNSVIGEWCNLGADTNTSNLKNDYGTVKLWNYYNQDFMESEKQFLGLIMGDHSKCGINTMFNTGTVVGVSCNIFGGNFNPKFIPSFSWGGAEGLTVYKFEKAVQVARSMMARRGLELDNKEVSILHHLFDAGAELRKKFH